jgi:hypothetical protein
MQDKVTANHPVDEAAIRNLYRKLLADRGRSDGESRAFTYTEVDNHGRRAPDKRARSGAPRGQTYDRTTHPI